jgi:DNA-binding winged helix-turn-helix (wHTH) protein
MSTGPQPTAPIQQSTLTFDGYTLDLMIGTLRRGEEDIKLRPKSYEALKVLAENAGRLVSKAELITALWPDTALVSDDSLTHCIMDVRRALGENSQHIIKTVPGRGYQFTASVRGAPHAQVSEPPASEITKAPAWRRHARSLIAAGFLLFLFAALAWQVKVWNNTKWVRSAVSRIETLTAAGK